MGSPCAVFCETSDTRLADRIAEFARTEAARIDRKFSRYRDDSVVHALHAGRGRPFEVDAETARLIEFGAALWRLSDGRFDLTSGVLRHAWRFEEGVCAADTSKIQGLLGRIGWQRVRWEPPFITLPEGMELDFGGFGKEYAADRAATLLQQHDVRHGMVNLGGDIRLIGPRPERV